jgi:monothiol glutaredoxin
MALDQNDPFFKEIDQLVNGNEVMVFMKGTPDFPQCGFSARVVHILKACGVEKFGSFDILSNRPLFDSLKKYSDWPTSPQLFVKGKLVGGSDIALELYERGELQELFNH